MLNGKIRNRICFFQCRKQTELQNIFQAGFLPGVFPGDFDGVFPLFQKNLPGISGIADTHIGNRIFPAQSFSVKINIFPLIFFQLPGAGNSQSQHIMITFTALKSTFKNKSAVFTGYFCQFSNILFRFKIIIVIPIARHFPLLF